MYVKYRPRLILYFDYYLYAKLFDNQKKTERCDPLIKLIMVK